LRGYPLPAHLRLVLIDTPYGEVAPHSIESVSGLSTRTGKESGDDSAPSSRPLFVTRLGRFHGILRLPVNRIALVANRVHGHELVLCPARGCGEPKLRRGHGLHPLGDPCAGRGFLGQRIGRRAHNRRVTHRYGLVTRSRLIDIDPKSPNSKFAVDRGCGTDGRQLLES